MEDSCRSIAMAMAGILVEYASQILTRTPCPVHDIVSLLIETGVLSNHEFGTRSLIGLSEIYPNSVIIEHEPPLGYFLIFYHTDSLKTLAHTKSVPNSLCPLRSEVSYLFDEPATILKSLCDQICAFTNDLTVVELASVQLQIDGSPLIPNTEICSSHSHRECVKSQKGHECDDKIHLQRIVRANGEPSDCSYLDTCFKGRQCKYVHYKTRYPDVQPKMPKMNRHLAEPQYINANILDLDFDLLGNDYMALIIDPPWDIHTKPGAHGGCSDTDVLNLKIDKLQNRGIAFLWVTGRVLDLGRHCLAKWGYSNVEELIWLKTNQLNKTICTGRTGHWLNHTKEHVLVGVKGGWSPGLRSMMDTDILVSNALGKSQKPEELYGIVDRLVGLDAKKLELFGRKTNIRPGWLTIGNELGKSHLVDSTLKEMFSK